MAPYARSIRAEWDRTWRVALTKSAFHLRQTTAARRLLICFWNPSLSNQFTAKNLPSIAKEKDKSIAKGWSYS
jgi:hypothetical protein